MLQVELPGYAEYAAQDCSMYQSTDAHNQSLSDFSAQSIPRGGRSEYTYSPNECIVPAAACILPHGSLPMAQIRAAQDEQREACNEH